MHASSCQPLRRLCVGLACAAALASCDAQEVASSVAASSSGPSPLVTLDRDRLWILLAAADMNPLCGQYYAAPTDARYRSRGVPCEVWEANTLELLRANGVPDLQPEHLREKAFWEWYTQKQGEILRCKEAVPKEMQPVIKRMQAEFSCDPYERATRVEKKTLADLGVRKP